MAFGDAVLRVAVLLCVCVVELCGGVRSCVVLCVCCWVMGDNGV